MSFLGYSFNQGFFHGMFNGTFGGFSVLNQSYLSPAPNLSIGNVFNYNIPSFSAFNTNMNWLNYNYTMPQMQTNFYQTDTYERIGASRGGRVTTREYSDSDASTYTGDANALKNRWSRINPSLSLEFYDKVIQIANRLNFSADDLMALMNSESGLDHTKENSIGATGLIQFMPQTAVSLGTTTEELKSMSAVDQLDYVESYIANAKRAAGYQSSDRIGPGTLYALVWLPAYANREILAERQNDPREYYAQNSGLDVNGDGVISKADLAQRIENKRA